MTDWLNRLGKWRTVLAGWQLGTRAKGDPECDAVRDHREATMMLRAEVNALAEMLIGEGVFTEQAFLAQVNEQAKLLCESYEKRFPGFRASDEGIEVDVRRAEQTTKNWRP